jgi:hypothetical protein
LVWVGTVYEAVIRDDPLMPNEIPLLSEKINVPVDTDCVPALKPNGVSATGLAILPVTVDPSSPKLTPFALLNTTAVRLLDVVPAEMLAAEMRPAVDGTV